MKKQTSKAFSKLVLNEEISCFYFCEKKKSETIRRVKLKNELS